MTDPRFTQADPAFIQIAADAGGLYALDADGDVWVYTEIHASTGATSNRWRRLSTTREEPKPVGSGGTPA